MFRINVRVDGLQETIRGLESVRDSIENRPGPILQRHLEQAVERIRTYPEELSGQVYVRTGVYGNTVSLNSVGREFTVDLAATEARRAGRPYSRYVGGDETGKGQYYLHKNRWANAYNEVVKAVKEALQEMDENFINSGRAAGLDVSDAAGEVDFSGLESSND